MTPEFKASVLKYLKNLKKSRRQAFSQSHLASQEYFRSAINKSKESKHAKEKTVPNSASSTEQEKAKRLLSEQSDSPKSENGTVTN